MTSIIKMKHFVRIVDSKIISDIDLIIKEGLVLCSTCDDSLLIERNIGCMKILDSFNIPYEILLNEKLVVECGLYPKLSELNETLNQIDIKSVDCLRELEKILLNRYFPIHYIV